MACGKKGPPLPPLVKLPVAPVDLAAERRGDAVDLSFTVPGVNTDGTRPANVSQAEVYAITAAAAVPPLSDADLLKHGTRVGRVQVKAPRDPNLTASADDLSDEVDAPEGPGLDQGALAHVGESLTGAMLKPVDLPRPKGAPAPPIETRTDGPLLGPPATAPVRTYAAFGVSTRGRKGPLSARVSVPLAPPPSPPTGATIAFTETAVSVAWSPAAAAPAATAGDVLASTAIGPAPAAIMYNVYDTTIPDAAVRLTKTPVADSPYSDPRIVWGERRCYIVVAAQIVDGATIESGVPPPVCETLVDTFPPSAPKGITAIASEGAINLIWEPNAEKDLAGYLVLRGVDPAEALVPITPAPIAEPSFKNTVQPGVAYVYVVRAVDRAGNASAPSARVVETAR